MTYLLCSPRSDSCAHSSCRLSVYFHICHKHGCARLRLPLLIDCRSLPFTVIELNRLYVYFLSPLLLWYFSHATTCTSSLFLDLMVPHAAYPYASYLDLHHSFVSNILSYFLGHHFPVEISRKNILYIALPDRVTDSLVWLSSKLKVEELPI